MRPLAVLLLAATATVAAPVPKGMKEKKPTLDGVWEGYHMTMNGRNLLPGDSNLWQMRGDTLFRSNRLPGGDLPPWPENAGGLIEFKADPDRPGEIDYTAGGGGKSLWRGRFEVTKDEFVVNFADQNAERPTELKEGVGMYYYKFKRVEK